MSLKLSMTTKVKENFLSFLKRRKDIIMNKEERKEKPLST